MCLYSLTPIPTILKEDLYCYKDLIFINGRYITPYKHIIVDVPGKIIGKGERKITLTEGFSLFEVGPGYIHAYLKSEYVFRLITHIRKYSNTPRHRIALCKIPRGIKVYYDFRDSTREVCAQEMEIIKIIV